MKLERGKQRQTIFHRDEDYLAFIPLLADGLVRYSVEIFTFTLMPTHWAPRVLRTSKDGEMGQFTAGTSFRSRSRRYFRRGPFAASRTGTTASTSL